MDGWQTFFSSLWFAICISLSQSLINVLVVWVTKGQGRLNKFNTANLSSLIETLIRVALISTMFFLDQEGNFLGNLSVIMIGC